MNTAELAKKVGISAKTVRRWIKEFDIPCGRNEYGHFVFEDKDIDVFAEIHEQLKNGTPSEEIDMKKLLPRRGTVHKIVKDDPQPEEQLFASLLERIKRNERKIEEKASDVVSYQLLQHRKEIEEIQQKVQVLESYIKKLESKEKEEKKEMSLVLDHQTKPRKRRRIMGFLF